jgi:hypothetical protein
MAGFHERHRVRYEAILSVLSNFCNWPAMTPNLASTYHHKVAAGHFRLEKRTALTTHPVRLRLGSLCRTLGKLG